MYQPILYHALCCRRAGTTPPRCQVYVAVFREVVRARMILLAAEGWPNDRIAARLGARREVVSMWRQRFFEDRLAGFEELPRPGRPRGFPQNWWCRSKLSPVNCPPPAAIRFPIGIRRTSPSRSVNPAWSPPSPAARSGAGSIKTPSGPGITAVESFHATHSSLPRSAAFSICTPAPGWQASARGRVRDLCRRKDQHSSSTPHPCHCPFSASSPHACRACVRPLWCVGLHRRPRCPSRPRLRPL